MAGVFTLDPGPPMMATPQHVKGNWAGIGHTEAEPSSMEHEPYRPLKGEHIEYFSKSVKTWVPATITDVDPETGDVQVNLKPGHRFALDEQRSMLRGRTRPTAKRLEWIRSTLRDGQMEKEAVAVFRRYCFREDAKPYLRKEDLVAVGSEIDRMFGISGSVCALMHQLDEDGGKLCKDGFVYCFWELCWGVQKNFGHALPMSSVAKSIKEDPQKTYQFGKELGRGTFGCVYLASHRHSSKVVACKEIYKTSASQQLDPEIGHLRALDHPHIVKLYEHYDFAGKIYLIMDYCSGGDLSQVIRRNMSQGRHFEEDWVGLVMYQIASAIAHVHERGMMHLDLKPGNTMLMPSRRTLAPGKQSQNHTIASPSIRPHVMVIDLGVAQFFKPGNFRHNRPIGTPTTMAPETWKGTLTPKADIFAIGVILFELLSLRLPFTLHTTEELEVIRYWALQPEVPWKCLQDRQRSQEAVNACQWLLPLDRHQRPDATDVLRMPFFRKYADDDIADEQAVAPPTIIELIVDTPKRTILHNSIALRIARQWPSNQLPTIRRLFKNFDTMGTGCVPKEKLAESLKKFGVDAKLAAEAAEAMDLSRNGTVDWSEFVAACLDLGDDSLEDQLRQIFREADQDRDGFLRQDDLKALLQAETLQGEALVDVFGDLAGCRDKNATVDFETFRDHFRRQRHIRFNTQVDFDLAQTRGAEQLRGGDCGWQAAAPAQGLWDALRPWANDLFQRARSVLRPQESSDDPFADNMKKLEEMGLTNKDLNLVALVNNKNRLDDIMVTELLKAYTQAHANGPPDPKKGVRII